MISVNKELFLDGIDDLINRFQSASYKERDYIRDWYHKILKSKKQRKLYDIKKLLNTIDLIYIIDKIDSQLQWQEEIGFEKLFIEIGGYEKYPEFNYLTNQLFEIDEILNTMPLTINATHDDLKRGCIYYVTSERFFKKRHKIK